MHLFARGASCGKRRRYDRDLPLSAQHRAFPGQVLPLHIFEDRYRLMIRQCLAEENPFGVVLIRRGQEVGETAEPYTVGTVARIRESTPSAGWHDEHRQRGLGAVSDSSSHPRPTVSARRSRDLPDDRSQRMQRLSMPWHIGWANWRCATSS